MGDYGDCCTCKNQCFAKKKLQFKNIETTDQELALTHLNFV